MGQRLGVRVDRIGGREQQLAALRVAERLPCRLRGVGPRDRVVEVGDGVHRRAADDFTGRRIGDVPACALRRLDAVEQRGGGCGGFGHR